MSPEEIETCMQLIIVGAKTMANNETNLDRGGSILKTAHALIVKLSASQKAVDQKAVSDKPVEGSEIAN